MGIVIVLKDAFFIRMKKASYVNSFCMTFLRLTIYQVLIESIYFVKGIGDV